MTPLSYNHSDSERYEDEDDWDGADSVSRLPVPSRKSSKASVAKTLLGEHWSPKPVPPPKVDAELPQLSLLERSTEVFRYMFCKAEYWLSPGGVLREWIKLNLRLSLLVAIPAILVAPLVTLFLGQFSAWVTYLTETTSKLVLFPLSALLVIGLACGLFYLARSLPMSLIKRSSRKHHPYYED